MVSRLICRFIKNRVCVLLIHWIDKRGDVVSTYITSGGLVPLLHVSHGNTGDVTLLTSRHVELIHFHSTVFTT